MTAQKAKIIDNMTENDLVQSIMNDILSNRWDTSQAALQKYKNESPKLNFCNVIFSMMRSTLLLDDAQLQKASEDLDACQKLCKDDNGLIMSTVKSLFSLVYTPNQDAHLLYERLFKDAIIADCKFFSAALVILKKERSTSLFHGMLEIRRAWRLYSSLQKRLFNSFKALDPKAEQLYGSDPNKLPELSEDDDEEFVDASDTISPVKDEYYNKTGEILGLEDVKSLLAAVSFGYGVMQLCFSFLPNRLLKLVRIFGFEGNRGAALKALYFTSHSNDVRSSLADLVLLFYSIIGPQLFGKSEIEMYLNTKDIAVIIDKNLAKNPTSSLFLYLKAKFYELNLKEPEKAMKCVELSHKYSGQIREFQSLTYFEMGFLSLMNLDYEKSLGCFEQFAKYSKWSNSFNVYIVVLIKGCLEPKDDLKSIVANALDVYSKRNFVEKFSRNRLNYLSQFKSISKYVCEFLLVEMLYFWMFIPYCNAQSLGEFLKIVKSKNDKEYQSVRCLLEGSICFALNELDIAVELMNASIEFSKEANQAPISRYTQPYSHCHLCCHYIDVNSLDLATFHLSAAKTFNDFEFRSRLQAQLRTIERRLNYKVLQNSAEVAEEDTRL